MTTSVAEAVDQAAIGEFAGRFMGMLNQTMLVSMLDLGRRTGLLDAFAQGPGTSDDIADRAGLNERYVREWLGRPTDRRLRGRSRYRSGLPGSSPMRTRPAVSQRPS